jgi:hypothetical protein
MTEYKVISTQTRQLSLTTSDKEMGILKYDKWFSFDAEIILANYTNYRIEQKK